MDLARQAMSDTAAVTVFAAVGCLALAAAFGWRAGRGACLLLAAAMLQHAVNRFTGSTAIQKALGGPTPAASWIAAVTNYSIAIPWALLVERMAGGGWHGSIRRTWQAFVVYAVAASAYDVALGRPSAAIAPSPRQKRVKHDSARAFFSFPLRPTSL